MKKYMSQAVALTLAVSASAAYAQIKVESNLEYDYTYSSTNASADNTVKSTSATAQSGRVEVNVTGRRDLSNGMFFAGKGTIRLKNDNTKAIQDAWGQFGAGNWDVKFGRFEATDLFPTGNDVVAAKVIDFTYGVNKYRGRSDNAAQAALTYKASDALAVEIGAVAQKTQIAATATAAAKESSTKALRPVVKFTGANYSVNAGFEYGEESGGTVKDVTGLGVTVGFKVAGGDVNVNLANGTTKNVDTSKSDITSIGVNGGWGAFSVGLINDASKETGISGSSNSITHNTLYAAYVVPVLAIDGATVTFAGSTSSLSGDKTTTVATQTNAIGARFNYTF